MKSAQNRELKLLEERVGEIKYYSPFWKFIMAPLIQRVFTPPHVVLERTDPQAAALISFYVGNG